MTDLCLAHSRPRCWLRLFPSLVAVVGSLLWPALPAPAEERGTVARWNELVEAYAAASFARNPSAATDAGFHGHDNDLEHLDPASIEAEKKEIEHFQEQLAQIDLAHLSPRLALDARFLTARLRADRADLVKDRPHEHDPSLYVHLAGGGVDALLKRSFAPVCDRLDAAAARAGQVPRLLAEGKQNLRHPPRLWTELAIEDLKGALSFYGVVVKKAAETCPNPATQRGLLTAATKAEAALRDFDMFLRRDLLPRSDGTYVLGEKRFAELLRDHEMIEEPIPALLARGYAELSRLGAEFVAVAKKIDPKKTPAQVLSDITQVHPTAERLLPEAREQVAGIRRFVAEHDIVAIPAGEDLHIEETPLFYRQTSFASMSSPGPFEQKAKEAYFYVTPVEPDWPEARKEEHLRGFDRFSMENTIIHEAYPGHYVQGLYAKSPPTMARKVLASTAYVEGWALYCERMLLDAGFDPDPRERLIMLQWALLRAVRYVGSIEMHARGMSFEQVVRLLKERAYLEPANADREAKRYTEDHLVLAYTYGDMTITALRKKAEKEEGPAFRLAEFHRRLLAEGPLPMALLGEGMARR